MDSGLSVQWPLSPFATAIATGALFAFCVTFWNTRPRNAPPQETERTQSVGSDIDCSNVLQECGGTIKKHVLKLEIPSDIIDTSAFELSSILYKSRDIEQPDSLVFALPRVRGSSSVTVRLLDFDGKLSNLNLGPFLRERKVPFSIFGNSLSCFPKLNPRDHLGNKLSILLEGRNSTLYFRYPFRDSSFTSDNVPYVFRRFSSVNQRYLRIKSISEEPITSAAKNLALYSGLKIQKKNSGSFYDKHLGIGNKFKIELEKKRSSLEVLEKKNSSLEVENNMNQSDGSKSNTNEFNFYRNEDKIAELKNYKIFNTEERIESNLLRDNSNLLNEDNFESDSISLNKNDINILELDKNCNPVIENDLQTNKRESFSNSKIDSENKKQHFPDINNLNNLSTSYENEIKNESTNKAVADFNFSKNDSNEKILLLDCTNVDNYDETPVILSLKINGTYGRGKCQDVKHLETTARASGFRVPTEAEMSINYPKMSTQNPESMKENLECIQESDDKKETVMTTRKKEISLAKKELSLALETKQTCTIEGRSNRVESSIDWKEGEAVRYSGTTTNDRDVRREVERESVTSCTRTADEREVHSEWRQMDRRSGERSDGDAESCIIETSVTSETRIQGNGETRVSAALTVDTRVSDTGYSNGTVKTVVTMDNYDIEQTRDEIFRPTYEEYMPDESKSLDATIHELNEIAARPLISSEPSSPRVDRLKALLNRDEERRARMKFFQEKSSSVNGSGGARASIDGEWDRILRDVLASVSELEHWEKDEEQRRRCDVTNPKREDAEKSFQHLHSNSSPSMEGEAAVLSPNKGETPTKVKNLRFKLDPDVFDVPSDDSFYADDDDDDRRPGWKKQSRYRAFSSLELSDEPVKLVSVHASVVPAGQKMVARPVGIDLRVRLTEERQSKRAHVGTSPSQVKRRSPVSDTRVGWCQELSPVTENVDWRETFTTVPKEPTEKKAVPNGILKTPSPKAEVVVQDSANPFKGESTLTNGTTVILPKKTEKPLYNGIPWKPPEKRVLSLPKKKFQPDPEAIDRITGYKQALTKPPLPPPIYHRVTSPTVNKISRAELARKQYLDNKANLSTPKMDGTKKFQQFLTQAQTDRARIITSVPDLVAIEKAVSEQWARERTPVSQRASPARDDVPRSGDTPSSRGSTPDDAWASYVQSCRKHLGRRSQSMTYLETDIDIVDIPILEDDEKWRSTSALGEPNNSESSLPLEDSDLDHSQDDLDDSGRAKSEHELRIQRSLQSLPLPSWYKQSEKPKTGFLLGSKSKEKQGWAATKSLASSTSSLASVGVKKPIRSLRSSRENIPWSRSSPSPDGPALSLALARAFREPYLGWRARTSTSSGVSSSPRTSPPSWSAATTDEEANGVSFDGEDAFGRTSSQEDRRSDFPSLDDTGADVATVSMDTGELVKLPGGEDTCDDINNMSMDTCELFDVSIVPEADDASPQADTGDDIDNLSTDTTEDKRLDPKFKRFSYSQSIYNSEWDDDDDSRGDCKIKLKERDGSPSSDNKVIWIESSFVGSRTTTSIMVLPEGKKKRDRSLERPASR